MALAEFFAGKQKEKVKEKISHDLMESTSVSSSGVYYCGWWHDEN